MIFHLQREGIFLPNDPEKPARNREICNSAGVYRHYLIINVIVTISQPTIYRFIIDPPLCVVYQKRIT